MRILDLAVLWKLQMQQAARSDIDGPAPTYAAMIAHNAEQLLQSLRAAEEKGAC